MLFALRQMNLNVSLIPLGAHIGDWTKKNVHGVAETTVYTTTIPPLDAASKFILECQETLVFYGIKTEGGGYCAFCKKVISRGKYYTVDTVDGKCSINDYVEENKPGVDEDLTELCERLNKLLDNQPSTPNKLTSLYGGRGIVGKILPEDD